MLIRSQIPLAIRKHTLTTQCAQVNKNNKKKQLKSDTYTKSMLSVTATVSSVVIVRKSDYNLQPTSPVKTKRKFTHTDTIRTPADDNHLACRKDYPTGSQVPQIQQKRLEPNKNLRTIKSNKNATCPFFSFCRLVPRFFFCPPWLCLVKLIRKLHIRNGKESVSLKCFGLFAGRVQFCGSSSHSLPPKCSHAHILNGLNSS